MVGYRVAKRPSDQMLRNKEAKRPSAE